MNVLDMFKLDGKVAFVTGAAQGIGASLAEALSEAGAKVALVDIQEDKVKETAKKIQEKTGNETLALNVDVTDYVAVQQMVKDVVGKFGKLDIAVNNAGMARNTPAEEMSQEEWHDVIDLNLNSVFYCTQAAGQEMLKKESGSIINIGSMSGHIVNVPQPQIHYNATKAGVNHLSASAAVEWAKRGVRVNSISPGYIKTDLLQSEELAPLLQQWEELTPMGRIGQPEELKGLVVYLASDASSFATGSDFIVDGGYSVV